MRSFIKIAKYAKHRVQKKVRRLSIRTITTKNMFIQLNNNQRQQELNSRTVQKGMHCSASLQNSRMANKQANVQTNKETIKQRETKGVYSPRLTLSSEEAVQKRAQISLVCPEDPLQSRRSCKLE